MDVDNVNLRLSDGVGQFAGLFFVGCAPVFGLQFPLPGESVDGDGLSGWFCLCAGSSRVVDQGVGPVWT